jgi:phosphocarrier protein FPr
VTLSKQFKSDIQVQHGEKKANAKSMLSVLTLGAAKGSLITVRANGEDEEQALAEIEKAIQAGLGDEPAEVAPPPAVAVQPVAGVPTAAVIPGGFQGIAAAPGIAIGPVFQFRQVDYDLDEVANLPPEGQLDLNEALRRARRELDGLRQQMVDKKLKAEAVIFEAHSELLEDSELIEAVQVRITGGELPVKAWKQVVIERAAVLAALTDPILAARADDLRDVGRRVMRLMLGISEKGLVLPEQPVVLLARELSPSETATFDTSRLLGFGIVNGGPTSHIAILARAMGLPAVVGADEAILAVEDQTRIILNGNDGTLLVDPAPEVMMKAAQVRQRWLEAQERARATSSLPAVTQDGHRVRVTANAGSLKDAEKAVALGADGIGLLRTEFLFMDRPTAPSEEEQFEVYRAIAQTMNQLPVIIRTLDIGGDKPLPYIQMKPELNPFLGERGIRLCLNRPELFREQLRGVLRTASYGKLRLMFPMISDISEVRQARALVDELSRELNAAPVQLGIMVEVPSAALMADVIAPEVDFFSIGTNDLTQYTLAMDRGHQALAAKQDGMHPAVLRLIAMTIEAAHKYGKQADICGELGSDPAAVPVLVGLGIDELSVTTPAVPGVKAQVRSLNLADAKPLAQRVLACATAQEAREVVKAHFA